MIYEYTQEGMLQNHSKYFNILIKSVFFYDTRSIKPINLHSAEYSDSLQTAIF